ncbi:MAG TPA: DUF4157 domain-containing protein [Candidatus Acidoferrum sp.]|nr:DUF4157 domain-containing protein [Candidatus Acidoferrum sp.]
MSNGIYQWERLPRRKSAAPHQLRKAADLADNRCVTPMQRKTSHDGLPDRLKSGIESLSGMSMDHVRVHYNSPKPATLNAHAYAQGSEIHLASGQEKHLPHEAWHVVQQAQGRVQPTMQLRDSVPVNDNAGLEREADVMGAKALGSVAQRQVVASSQTTTDVVQRKITMVDGTVFNGAADVGKVMARIKLDGGVWEDQLGSTLPKMLKNGDYGPYASGRELLAAIKSLRGSGERAAAIGEARERQVAAAASGSVADSGKYGQDKVVHLHGSNRHVKLDIESPTVYGIVGGPAKAGNLVKFRGICGDLDVIAKQDGKTPKVYCTHDTPESVAETAKDVVGAGNVINLDTHQPWDFHKDKKTAATSLLGGAALGGLGYLGLGSATAYSAGLVGTALVGGVAVVGGLGLLGGYLLGKYLFGEKPKRA